MTVTILSLIAASIIFLCGLRARNPHPIVWAMIQNPAKRRLCSGLFIPSGLITFIHPAADATTCYSLRYGRGPLSLQTVGWAIGLASVFVTSAVYLGWAVFDITTLGGWSFFDADTPAFDRAIQTAAALIPLALFVAAAADIDALQLRFPRLTDNAFGVLHTWAFVAFVVLHMRYFGNHGANILALGVLLLSSKDRKLTFQIFAACLVLAIPVGMLGYVDALNATFAAIVVFIAVVAAMSLLSFVTTVETLSALRWYQSDPAMIFAGTVAGLLVGLLCALGVPFLMVVLLYAVMMLAPDSISAPWVAMVDVFRTGGLPAAMMLAFASLPPMLPPVWFLTLGLGNALARAMPMMRAFIGGLQQDAGPQGHVDLAPLLVLYRQSHGFGFALAALAGQGVLAATVWLIARVYTVGAAG